jgi:uncharacterized protein (DUF1501 family)
MLQPTGAAFASSFCGGIPIIELHLNGEAPDHLLLPPAEGTTAWNSLLANNPSLAPTLPVAGLGTRSLLTIRGNSSYGFHPNLTNFQAAMNNLDANKYSLASVNYCGHSTNRDFGHDTSWMKVSSADVRDYNPTRLMYGWAGLLADQCYAHDPGAVFSFRNMTLTAKGARSKVNVLRDLNSLGMMAPRGGEMNGFYIDRMFKALRKTEPSLGNISDTALREAWNAVDVSTDLAGKAVQKYNQIPASMRATYGNDHLSQQFLNAARLIRSGTLTSGSIHLAHGGWDVHENALPRIHALTNELNGAIGSFLRDMEAGAHDVILIVWHAFGRNSFQNQNTMLDANGRTISVPGNDHGHGRVVHIFGRGSRIYPGVHGPSGYRPEDFENPSNVRGAVGWIPGGEFTVDRGVSVPGVDFREVLAQVLQQVGADPVKIIPQSFPKSRYNIKIFK